MNAFGILYVAVLVAFRGWGERWRPRVFRDQQDQQEFANQGKYSMGSTLMSYSLLLITHLHVSNFDTRKDIQVFDYPIPWSPMGYMHMGSLLALNVTEHDLHID